MDCLGVMSGLTHRSACDHVWGGDLHRSHAWAQTHHRSIRDIVRSGFWTEVAIAVVDALTPIGQVGRDQLRGGINRGLTRGFV